MVPKILKAPLYISLILITGCGSNNDEIARLRQMNDSLMVSNQVQQDKIREFENTVALVNDALDAIDYQERMIFTTNSELPVTKESVKANLKRFEDVVKFQQEKLEKLESQLNANNDSLSESRALINHLKKQIEEKNNLIAQLQEEIEKKNIDINKLKEQVESQILLIEAQDYTITELEKRNKKQGEALSRQDAILNNGYVLVGSKEDLKRKGILKKGKLVPESVLDRSKFYQVDIREYKEVKFKAKKPKILSSTPPNSYELTTSGNREFTLTITNPSAFWGVSNYLIIQTD